MQQFKNWRWVYIFNVLQTAELQDVTMDINARCQDTTTNINVPEVNTIFKVNRFAYHTILVLQLQFKNKEIKQK